MTTRIEKINAAALNTLNVAAEMNVPVCITVIDTGGHVIFQIRSEGANYLTNEVSYLKAKTAFLFNCPSHVLRNITEHTPILAKTIEKVPGDACLLEGGMPLKENGKIIGGVGISGGNFEQDLMIATAFVEKLNEFAQRN